MSETFTHPCRYRGAGLAGRIITAVMVMGLAVAWGGASQAADESFTPVTDEMLQNPDSADWLMWRRTRNAWGYSPLDQITADNVGQLRLVWSRGLETGIMEGTPLVHDGVMYFPNPGDVIQAIDAATGDVLWEHRRDLPEDLGEYVNAPFINRSLAIYEDLIIDLSADGHVYAMDARTGEEVWDSEVHDYKTGVHQTSGPIIVKGMAISGRGCDPAPEASPETCVITAHDAETGKEVWRKRTIPKPDEPGGDTWGDVPYEERLHVGTWIAPSYDPELDLIFFGTSVTAPAPKYLLGGNDEKHLYHNSTLALDPDTGETVWYYQHLVDHWDLDHPFERLIVETEVAPDPDSVAWINPDIEPGEKRKVITGIPGKTGVVYTLDAKTGEFLWARPTIMQNVLADIDPETGEATVNPDALFHEAGEENFICPSPNGGKNWPAGAYSPLTNTMYYPLQNTCSDMTAIAGTRGEAAVYGTRPQLRMAPGTDNVGSIHAVSAETGGTAWQRQQRAATLSLLTTGSGLLFGGDIAGRFRAYDQETGQPLWEVNLGSAVTGYPISFAVDGQQYIAVAVGQALASGAFTTLTPEIRPSATNNLFVFALPRGWEQAATSGEPVGRPAPSSQAETPAADSAAAVQQCRLPEPRDSADRSVHDGVYTADQAKRGETLYQQECAVCHGADMEGTPTAPALGDRGFRLTWDGQTAATLFDCLRNTMPPGRTGTLSDRELADLVAAILAANDFPAADTGDGLPGDTEAMRDILIEPAE